MFPSANIKGPVLRNGPFLSGLAETIFSHGLHDDQP